MRRVLLFFIFVPFAEMLLLFEVADKLGGLSTLTLVILTAVIGVQILKRQGLSTLTRANQRLRSGELPAREIVEGMLLAGAGAMLLTPGFLTDSIGFAVLFGPLRQRIAGKIIQSGAIKAFGTGQSAGFSAWSSPSNTEKPDFGNIYEGEYAKEDSEILIQDTDSSEKTQN